MVGPRGLIPGWGVHRWLTSQVREELAQGATHDRVGGTAEQVLGRGTPPDHRSPCVHDHRRGGRRVEGTGVIDLDGWLDEGHGNHILT